MHGEEILIPMIFFMVPIVAIVMNYRYKIEKLRLESSKRSGTDIVRELEDLRTDHEQFILGFDARLKRIENRLSSLEAERQQASRPHAGSSPVAPDSEAVSVRRIES